MPESWHGGYSFCMAYFRRGYIIFFFFQLQVAIVDVNNMINSIIFTAGVYRCNLSLPLSNKQRHLHSSRIPLEGSVALLHSH